MQLNDKREVYLINIKNDTYFTRFTFITKTENKEEAIDKFLRRYRFRVIKKLGPEPRDDNDVISRMNIELLGIENNGVFKSIKQEE